MTNVTRSLKDVIISYHMKVSTYKPEFTYAVQLDNVINEADEGYINGKLFDFDETTTSNASNKYIECIIVDTSNCEQNLKVFGDLIHEVKENTACMLTDLKVVIGADQ